MKYITDVISILRGSGFRVLNQEYEDCNTEPLKQYVSFFPPGGVTTSANGYSIILRIIKSLSLNLHN